MKFSLIFATAVGAIAVPHAEHLPSPSLVARSYSVIAPSAPPHSASLPAHETSPLEAQHIISGVTSEWIAQSPDTPEGQEQKKEKEKEKGKKKKKKEEHTPAKHESPVVAEMCKEATVVTTEVKELVEGDIETISTPSLWVRFE